MTTPRIAIIGAGIAGLTLTRVLQINGIRPTVFELDASANARNQGGTLDLHPDGGQLALKACDLYDEFLKVIRMEAQAFVLFDKHGKVHLKDEAREETLNSRPEIDRGDIRRILLNAIDQGTIQWGTRVHEVKRASSGEGPDKYTVVYNDTHEETFDLVVGADGAWSKVRQLLSPHKPAYTGFSFIEMHFTDEASAHYPDIQKVVGGGSCFAISDGMCLMAQQNSASIRNYLCFASSEDKFAELERCLSDPEQARRHILGMIADWDDKFKDMIRFCDDTFVHRPMYALPVPHVWETKPGLTLVGDAAHLMSPFAGEGANLAMWDGSELGLAIADAVETGKPLADAVAAFEQQMYEKSRPAAEISAKNLKNFSDPKQGLQSTINFVTGMEAMQATEH